MSQLRKLAVVVVALGSMSVAQATPITYEFDGGPFTDFNFDAPTGLTGMSAVFTLDLLPNIDQTNVAISSWSISDGLTTIDQADTDYAILFNRVQTDASGMLIGFELRVRWFPFNTIDHPIPVGVNSLQWFVWGSIAPLDVAYNTTLYCIGSDPLSGICRSGAGAETRNAGIVTSVPEPGTLALFGIGLAGIGLARRRKT